MIISYRSQNFVNEKLFDLLHETNLAINSNSTDACAYLKQFLDSWLLTAESIQPDSSLLGTNTYLLWARISPLRCDFQQVDGIITVCSDSSPVEQRTCELWQENSTFASFDRLPAHFAEMQDIRVGGIREIYKENIAPCWEGGECRFETHVLFNDNFTVSYT
jgi:hypothetical protein